MSVLLITSFVAGFLTVLAPCVLPLLPVLLAGSVQADKTRRVLFIILGLAVSVILFSLLLKSLTVFLGIPQIVWQLLSGGILILFGIVMLFPEIWEKVSLSFSRKANQSLVNINKNQGTGSDFLLGAALGPVFNSCSPTYALIVAVILPASFTNGFIYLIVYTLGLSLALLLVALLGRALVVKLGWAVNPSGWFRKIIGFLLVVAGIAVIFGLDKKFQTFALDKGYYEPINQIEERLRLPK